MDAPKTVLRITKTLGKAILGLLLVLITVVAIVHLPPVQKQITPQLASYLSSKIQARVSIQRATFSILGKVTIEDLTVWDRHQNKILSARKIEASSDIFDLIAGELIFDDIHLAGIEGKLSQSKEGLNIQFIIDAFKPRVRPVAREPVPVNVMFKRILLENISFEFTSSVSGTTVTAVLGTFASQKAELSTNPTSIKAGQIILKHTVINSLSTQPDHTTSSVTLKKKKPISPDFGTGIAFEIKDLQLIENDVSFHQNQIVNTRKFDPTHVVLKNIQIHLSNILMSQDSLSAALQSLSLQLPGFTLANTKADIHMNRTQLVLSGVRLASGANELRGDITAPYDFRSNEDTVHAHVEVDLRCQLTPGDLAYFFSDSVMNQFSQWGTASLSLEGSYSRGMGEIRKLDLRTGKSRVNVQGMLHDVLDPDKIGWRDVLIDASIGPEFTSVLNPFLRKISLPPDVVARLRTSGNPRKLFADTKIFTRWGDVKSVGSVFRRRKAWEVDMNLTGDKVDLREWLNQPSLGPMDLSVHAKGTIGEDQHIEVSGLINQAEILNHPIRYISFQSATGKRNSSVLISIDDSDYRADIASEISFAGPLVFTNSIQWNDFHLGRLLRNDSTFKISGNTKLKITIGQSLLEAYVEGNEVSFQNKAMHYLLDTMFAHVLISPTRSDFTYFTEHAKANLESNFDIRDASQVIQSWSQNVLGYSDTIRHSGIDKTARLDMELQDASIIKLLGVDVDEFSFLRITGEFDEQKESASVHGTLGQFRGYGIDLDTLNTDLKFFQGNISASMRMSGLTYDSIPLGNLHFDLLTNGDTTVTDLLLANDTLTFLDMRANILSADSGRLLYADKLLAFNNNYLIDPKNPVHIKNKSVAFNHFRISRDDMQINLNGDLNDFELSVDNLDLTPLNFLLSRDTTIISQGHLTGRISYSRDQQLDLKANIDSLRLYNSNPLTISATALSHGNEVPFGFLLTNETNKIDLKGRYFPNNTEVDASLLVDVTNPEVFQFLVSGIFDELKGSVKGKTTISGPLQRPALKGSMRFRDMRLTTANPKIAINVEDDSIMLENTALLFNNFTIYDKEHHPLNITGKINFKDYQSLAYDLQIDSEEFALINNPDSISNRLSGLLAIDSEISLKGSETDTNIEAKLAIKDATNLSFVTSGGDIELATAEGIIDFIDPAQLLDSVALGSANYYDSLLASLPEFNLHSTIAIEDKAAFRVIINEQSGDYIEVSGKADLEVEYDRIGNLNLSGNYTINKGVYRLSFYDLVKKNFELVAGSSINWSGSPKNGDLNIKARHTVQSNSIGLIGHEIGESEKATYKRSLDYEVGINIGGTVERPVISFSLDLPQDDKVSYPVLASKLDRMRQPEYQSELNKQVFGLLVFGGFLPEASTANVSSNLVATTALSNSVNALLASQLNRFASQHIKGVTIDVGIQSYSDYSAPGGKTQTAMDFRVTKSLMNDRLSFEIGGDFDINQDQSGSKTGDNYRGDIAIIYDLTGNGDKKLKLFNNETYDIVYQEIRNTGVSLIFIRESDRRKRNKNLIETASKDK